MNKSIRELLSEVKVPNKFDNADSRVTNRYIYSLLVKHRDYLIKQVDNKYKLSKLPYLFQPLRCVDLVKIPLSDPCCGVKTKCVTYRTKTKIPNIVSTAYGPYIKNVTSVDGSTEIFKIQEREWYRKLEDTNSKYDKGRYYFFKNDYLYFPNINWKKIEIEAYFEDELEKHNLCDEKEEPCLKFLDQKFRIPKELVGQLIDKVNVEVANYYQRIQPDENQIDKNDLRKGQ